MVSKEAMDRIMKCYEENKDELHKMQNFIRKHGCLENGLCEPEESFESGWNSCMEFVLGVLREDERNHDDGCWYTEKWYKEDLENALKEAMVPVTEDSIREMENECRTIFNDKSDRNEILVSVAERMFKRKDGGEMI